jgi:hypothetical protein
VPTKPVRILRNLLACLNQLTLAIANPCRPVMCETKACGGGKAHCCELDRSQCYQKPSWSDYNLGGLRVCNVSAAPRASADSTCETVRTLRNLLVA